MQVNVVPEIFPHFHHLVRDDLPYGNPYEALSSIAGLDMPNSGLFGENLCKIPRSASGLRVSSQGALAHFKVIDVM